MIRLHQNWLLILRHAWSVRLILAAGLLAGAEAMLLVLQPVINLPMLVLACLSGVLTFGALVARLLAQKEFRNGQRD
jgi:CDP-diglyceride synthetase